VQPFLWSFACYQFAMLGVIEATLPNEEEKNRLCPPIHYWDANADYLRAFLAALANERAVGASPALASWAKSTRLNPLAGMGPHRDAPGMAESRERVKRFGAAAAGNLVKLLRLGA
jgi:hypothetical protein